MTGAPATAIGAVALLAAALLPAGPGRRRLRELTVARTGSAAPDPALRPVFWVVGCCAVGGIGWVLGGAGAAVPMAGAAAAAGVLVGRRAARRELPAEDGAEIASFWLLLAVCLEAGMSVAGALLATAPTLTGVAGRDLRRVAGLLALGADAVLAWRSVERQPALAAFARAAARSASTGGALAGVARAEAARLRAAVSDTAQTRAERAAVLITGPLGLCFLPAFLVLGVAPVVIGLASRALAHW